MIFPEFSMTSKDFARQYFQHFHLQAKKHLQALDQGSRVAGLPQLMEDGSISIYPHRGK